MKPARSLAASVVALGLTGGAPAPAIAAPAPCERAESYAAQSGAELLRIDRLSVRSGGGGEERPVTKDPDADSSSATDRILGTDATPIDPADDGGEDGDTPSEGIGMLGSAVIDSVLPDNSVFPHTDATSSSAESDSSTESDSAPADDTGGIGGGGIGGGGTGGGGAGGGGTITGADDAPKTAEIGEIGLGEARTAMVGTAAVKSAAVARLLDGKADGEASWTEPVLQQAPPSHDSPLTRGTPAGRVGPLKLGAGELSGHARWDAGMACGGTAGEAARARSAVHGASLYGGASAVLVRVPQKAAGVSTTALDGPGGNARSVASATVEVGRIDLADGRVRVRVLRAPSLVASMSTEQGGRVRYQPALVEISGDGIATKRLDAVGSHVDLTLGPDRQATESGLLDTAGLGRLHRSRPLPLPTVPGVPTVSAPAPITESAPATGDGTRLHIEVGGVRQARKGHAIAARATALTISLTQGGSTGGRTKAGYGGGNAVSLDLAVGLMEAAAVAPERQPSTGTSGEGAGLPITGPRVAGLATGGVALLVTGVAAMVMGRRRRRS